MVLEGKMRKVGKTAFGLQTWIKIGQAYFINAAYQCIRMVDLNFLSPHFFIKKAQIKPHTVCVVFFFKIVKTMDFYY